MKIHLTLPALLLALGIAGAGFFVSKTILVSKTAMNTAEVKGLAERRVKATLANWTVGISNVGKTRQDVPSLYALSEEQQQKIVEFLKSNGLEDKDITVEAVEYEYQEFRDEDEKLTDQKHILSGKVSIETEKVDLVVATRTKLGKLIAEGLNISNYQPAFRFTELNEIKPDMLKEATTNARVAANEFAKNAGAKVEGIKAARQGNFTILDAGKTYGNTEKIEKEVRVVTTITFYLG